MVKRIALLGAESTGKTTLAAALASHYNTLWVPEYGRIFVEQHGRLPKVEEMLGLAQAQIVLEEQYAQNASNVLFCDTTPLTTALYSQYYFGQCASELTELAAHHSYDLVLLMDDDIPWVADGIQRDGVHIRAILQPIFKQMLHQFGIIYHLISGDLPQRMAHVQRLIKPFLETN